MKQPTFISTAAVLAMVALMMCLDLTSSFAHAASAPTRFRSHPHLRCSVCMVLCEQLGHKMNESAKIKTSVQNSHRLTKTNKVRRIDYESSELRAVELLEGICGEVSDKYSLREDHDGVRRFSSNKSLPSPKWYGPKDKEHLDNHNAKLKDTCFEFTDEYDELLTELIRVERQLEALQTRLCVDGIKVCHTKAYYVGLKEERENRKRWEARAEERRKRDAEMEEKQRLQREKDAGFDWRQNSGGKPKSEETEASGDDTAGTPGGVEPANVEAPESAAAPPSAPTVETLNDEA